MSKVIVRLSKQEAVEAILDYFKDQMSAGYRKKFTSPELSFSNKDGDIGYFECLIEFEVGAPEPKSLGKED